MRKMAVLAAALLLATALLSLQPVGSSAEPTFDEWNTFDGSTYQYTTHLQNGRYWSEITAYSGTAENLTVQSSMEGYQVTSIGDSAFSGNTYLKTVIIPERVTVIGKNAFSGCTQLNDIYFMGPIPEIGQGALGSAAAHYLSAHSGSWDGYSGSKSQTEEYSDGSLKYYIVNDTAHVCGWMSGSRVEIPASVTKDGIVYEVRSVAPWAFYSNWNITEVSIAEGVSMIEERAFMYCKNLSSLTLPSTLLAIDDEAFRMEIPSSSAGSEASLEVLTLPSGLEYMGFESFRMNCEITAVTVPDSVTTYKEGVFRACYKLESVTLGSGIDAIPDWSFDNCYALRTVTAYGTIGSVGNSAFLSDSNLTDLNLVNGGVTEIGSNAFSECTSLISFPMQGVERIGSGAFYNCVALEEAVLDSAVSIGDGAFKSSGVMTVSIGECTGTIGRDAFLSCPRLTDITVDSRNTEFLSIDGVLFSKDMELKCYPSGKALSSYTIPDGTTALGDSSMQGAKFSKVTIPSTVTEIGPRALSFTSLAEVTIPSSVRYVGDRAMYECSEMRYAHFEGAPPEFGVHVFRGAHPDFTIFYDEEHSASWKDAESISQYEARIWEDQEGDGASAIMIAAIATIALLLAATAVCLRRR